MKLSVAALAAGACRARPAVVAPATAPLDAAAYHATRRFAELPAARIAYVERGAGNVALFLHGAPLAGFQWRGAIDRLAAHRRCVAPDFMGLGYSEVPADQPVTPAAQVAMIAAFLDRLAIPTVDLVANDSGGAIAQLFMVQHPDRVRTALLTNCDAEPDSPPPKVLPVIELARTGKLAAITAGWLSDPAAARTILGAAAYQDPRHLTDEMIAYYWAPLRDSPVARAQHDAYHVALAPNPLAGIEPALRRCQVPTRIVWGTADDVFSQASAGYLDRTLPRSRGVRPVPGAKLFFPEEYPDVIAEEARRLWGVT